MSFTAKVDPLGIDGNIDGLKCKSYSDGASQQVLQIVGKTGSIIGDEQFGAIKAPSCDYVITGNASLASIVLGKAFDDDGIYAINSIQVKTSAGGEPSLSITGVQIETNDDKKTLCTYKPSTITVSPKRHPLTFGAFTYVESVSLVLESADYNANADISPATVNGSPVASDATQGVETVQATFWSSS